jgi:hypothetical protein
MDIGNCNGELTCGSCVLPDGPYQDSCSDCVARSDRLYCRTCERTDGSAGDATALPLPCTSDINNCDGSLTCGGC